MGLTLMAIFFPQVDEDNISSANINFLFWRFCWFAVKYINTTCICCCYVTEFIKRNMTTDKAGKSLISLRVKRGLAKLTLFIVT